jgi:hypothetical protein
VCFRCKRTGRKRDGYQPHRVQFLAGIGPGLDRQLPNPPLIHNANTPEEARELQFYRERTALKLSDHSHSQFWLRLVPQVSYSDLAVKHIIVTLASIEGALGTAPNPWAFFDRCLKRHSKAISWITRTAPAPTVEVVLIFFSAFCFLLQYARQIFGSFKPRRERPPYHPRIATASSYRSRIFCG